MRVHHRACTGAPNLVDPFSGGEEPPSGIEQAQEDERDTSTPGPMPVQGRGINLVLKYWNRREGPARALRERK